MESIQKKVKELNDIEIYALQATGNSCRWRIVKQYASKTEN